MAVSAEVEAGLAAKFASMRRLGLSERQWREYLGIEARALGHGGIAAVARASGCPETTVAAGVTGTEGGGDELPAGRSRRPGGGRKRAADAQPGLREAVLDAAEEGTRGDPMVAVTWCSLSLREIARRMIAQGLRCGKDAVARILREDGYSLQGMAKVLEGWQHPDRDAQFRGINAAIAEYLAAGLPAVSVTGRRRSSPARSTGRGRPGSARAAR